MEKKKLEYTEEMLEDLKNFKSEDIQSTEEERVETMKHNRIKRDIFNSVTSSFLTKFQSRLRELENDHTGDEWGDGANFGRMDMIEEVMKMIEDLSKNYS